MNSHVMYPIKASNRLLAALPSTEWEKWQPRFEMVNLKIDQIIYEIGSNINYIYFPVNCIISLQYDFQDGASAEFAQIGNEGLCGYPFLWVHSQPIAKQLSSAAVPRTASKRTFCWMNSMAQASLDD